MFDDGVTDAARAWLTERYRLMPYLLSLAHEASQTGAPILRPLVWEFPDDVATYDLADEAMLGPYLLVAPAVTQGATSRSVYLPAGRWFEWGTDRVFDGPTTIEVRVLGPLQLLVDDSTQVSPHAALRAARLPRFEDDVLEETLVLGSRALPPSRAAAATEATFSSAPPETSPGSWSGAATCSRVP